MFEHLQRLNSSRAENLFAVDFLSVWSGLFDVKCFSKTGVGGGGFRIEMFCSHPSSQSTWTAHACDPAASYFCDMR